MCRRVLGLPAECTSFTNSDTSAKCDYAKCASAVLVDTKPGTCANTGSSSDTGDVNIGTAAH